MTESTLSPEAGTPSVRQDAGLSANMTSQLPFGFAQQQGVLLALDDPSCVISRTGMSYNTLAELSRKLGIGFSVREVSEPEFQQTLTRAYQRDNQAVVQVAEDMGADINLARLADEIPDTGDLMEAEDDAPVIKLINAIISQAVREQVSDIHIETYEDRLTVRFRIDGILTEVLSPKRLLAPMLVSRIKVMAKMNIAEKRISQDGRIGVRLAGHAIDIRVSTLPTPNGERVVLRLLDKKAGQLELSQLHMSEVVQSAYVRALNKPHGIILVTGPTGSGKTTMLYAGLMHINDRRQNILTIEDPIEYTLPGVGQTQVNNKVNMTFANGLRSILRQDPDVVMLGEIRDTESARIAVQASLTGHLVLSTLHTNSAVGAITRLQDMGVEPFLLSSSLSVVIAQRLLRVLCRYCKEACTPDERERELLAGAGTAETIYRPVGCEHCKQTGYQHRTAIFELIEIDATLKKLIHDEAGETELLSHARTISNSILNDGFRRVLAGDTSIEEVLRVTAA
jgi:general secretion pathway protein E